MSQFGAYPGVATSYYQPDHRIKVNLETARIQRGTIPNITITTKGTNRIEALAKPGHPDHASALQWLQTYVDDLAAVASVDPKIPVYATIDHEFKVKVRTGMITGPSARTDYYGQVLDMFFAMAKRAHPNIRTTYWMVGYDREFEADVASHFRTLPDAILFDPYASEPNQTIESIVADDVAWIRGQSWYVGQEIAIGEFGIRVSTGDDAMAAFFTNAGQRFASLGISWAVFFNRERDYDTRIIDRTDGRQYPKAVAAFSTSLQQATPCVPPTH